MFTEQQVEEIVNLLCTLDENTKLYIGTDSIRFKSEGKWFAKYATVLVVHMNGRHGCKVFKHHSIEPDYDLKKNRPSMRMMAEISKSCELYNQIAPLMDCYDVEIHCDVNPNKKFGSSCVADQAAGYVLGMTTGLTIDQVKLKPDAFCASFGADHALRGAA